MGRPSDVGRGSEKKVKVEHLGSSRRMMAQGGDINLLDVGLSNQGGLAIRQIGPTDHETTSLKDTTAEPY